MTMQRAPRSRLLLTAIVSMLWSGCSTGGPGAPGGSSAVFEAAPSLSTRSTGVASLEPSSEADPSRFDRAVAHDGVIGA